MVVMNDALPPSVKFQSITAAGWSCSTPAVGNSGTVTCNRATLAAAVSSPITIQGTLSSAGTISNTATVASATTDPTTPNSSIAATSVLSPANVGVVKSATGGPFLEMQNVTYSVVMTNNGGVAQGDNPGDEMTDVLPSALTLVSATATAGSAVTDIPNNTVHWNGSIPGGGSVTVTIVATIKSGTAGTPIANQATVHFDADANGTNESTSSSTATITPQPASAIPAFSELALVALVGTLLMLALMKA